MPAVLDLRTFGPEMNVHVTFEVTRSYLVPIPCPPPLCLMWKLRPRGRQGAESRAQGRPPTRVTRYGSAQLGQCPKRSRRSASAGRARGSSRR